MKLAKSSTTAKEKNNKQRKQTEIQRDYKNMATKMGSLQYQLNEKYECSRRNSILISGAYLGPCQELMTERLQKIYKPLKSASHLPKKLYYLFD